MVNELARAWLPLASVLILTLPAATRADVATPEPKTAWRRGEEPSGNTVVAAGAAISAVIVAAGLVIVRWPVKSTLGRIAVALVAGLALLAVWGAAGGTLLRAERDRGLWKQWEINESNRRSNWRGPPDNFPPAVPPPPTSAPPPDSSPSAPPTAAAESVQ